MLFESFADTKFYRFNHFDLLGGEESLKLVPKKRKMVGPENINAALVKKGFPDKHQCVHFMDEKAFDPSNSRTYNMLYGEFVYEIQIDSESKIGWSFFLPVNDWLYKAFPAQRELGNPALKDLAESEYAELSYPEDEEEEQRGDLDKMAELLMRFETIGTGTLEDLKRSKHFGKQKLFVWTGDPVMVRRWSPPKKQEKAGEYKKERILAEEDFEQRGIAPEGIARFYASRQGGLFKRIDANPRLSFEDKREEALRLLDEWAEGI